MFTIVFLFTFLQFTSAQDPWIEWGQMLYKRCMHNHKNEDNCERLQDAYEEMFERVAITVLNQVKSVSAYQLYQLSLRTPYLVIGERIVDFSISKIEEHLQGEDKYEMSIKDNMLGWLYNTATQDAFNMYKAIRDDEYYDRKEMDAYLEERKIDLNEIKSMDDEELKEYVKDSKVEL